MTVNDVTTAPAPAPGVQTVPGLSPRLVQDDLTNGPGFALRSEVAGAGSHFIDLEDTWKIWPADCGGHLTLTDARIYLSELQLAIATADLLNSNNAKGD